jgi:hypothetical protein
MDERSGFRALGLDMGTLAPQVLLASGLMLAPGLGASGAAAKTAPAQQARRPAILLIGF